MNFLTHKIIFGLNSLNSSTAQTGSVCSSFYDLAAGGTDVTTMWVRLLLCDSVLRWRLLSCRRIFFL